MEEGEVQIFFLIATIKGFDLIMATFQKLIMVNVSIGLKGIINHV